MFLDTLEIEKNIQWLIKNASPPVAYLTNLNLLHTDPKSDYMAALWSQVKDDPAVKYIFSVQNEDGSWFSGGPWGPKGYSRKSGFTATRPKFVTTAWILPFLGEIGFRADDERIKKAADFILSQLNIDMNPPENLPTNYCGLCSVSLWGLSSVGMANDKRLNNEWMKLLHCQRPDGGWLNPNHLADSLTPSKTKGRWPWDRSCVWGSYYAVRALYAARRQEDNQALAAASKFLYTHLAGQEPERLKTWVFHGHNLVRELEIFFDAGIDMDLPLIKTILGWLRGFYRVGGGVFRTQDKPVPDFARQVSGIYKSYEIEKGKDYWKDDSKVSYPVLRYSLYQLVEDDWLTYRLTGLAMKMRE